jgi:site-specific DNA-methyltransferase (adenine-specific)
MPSGPPSPLELHWPGKRRQVTVLPRPLRLVERFGTAEARNQLLLGDNLPHLAHLRTRLSGQVDLIAIDPPFATGRHFTSEGTGFADDWADDPASYLQMLYDRFVLARDLLAPTGLIYVHLDYRMSAAVRLLLDEVFGSHRFFNEIIWHYQSGGRTRRAFAFKHDTLLVFARGDRPYFDPDAVRLPRGSARRNHMKRGTDVTGRSYSSIRSAGKEYRYYDDEGVPPSDVWSDISHLHQKDPERVGYPTQKPVRLLERIVAASSPPNGLVLDFFCGSGTTAVAAERLGRSWIACDENPAAIAIARDRLLAIASCRPFEILEMP